MTAPALLEAHDVVRHYKRGGPFSREVVRAVDQVTLHVARGETLGIVGESGCGKSTLGRVLIGMEPATAGTVSVEGAALPPPGTREWRARRRDLQMIFQDAFGALDPRMTVGEQIREPLDIHALGSMQERACRVREMLDAVRLPIDTAGRYPHELSGGQLQRVVIARALVTRPKLVVCDEAVASLDASIQAQIINLLCDLQAAFGLTYVFISHDLKVVRHISTRVAILYLGQCVELGTRDGIFEEPRHPYTQALMSAIPVADPTLRRRRILLTGDPPSPIDPPSGCRFRTRCPIAVPRCAQERPSLEARGGRSLVACHRVGADAP